MESNHHEHFYRYISVEEYFNFRPCCLSPAELDICEEQACCVHPDCLFEKDTALAFSSLESQFGKTFVALFQPKRTWKRQNS